MTTDPTDAPAIVQAAREHLLIANEKLARAQAAVDEARATRDRLRTEAINAELALRDAIFAAGKGGKR